MAKVVATKTRGIGDNSGALPTHDDIRSAAAMEMIFEEKEKKLREEKKRARSRLVEGKGLLQEDMTFLKSLRDKPASDVIEIFRRRWHVIGAFYPEQHEQMDLFTQKSEAPVRAAYFTMGLVAGLNGKDLEVPPMVAGDDRQQMIDGHNEGMARRQAAWDSLAAGDGVVDGTGTQASGAAAAVGDKAAADFAQDNGDPLVVAGIKYPNMRQANAARKRLDGGSAAAPEPEVSGSVLAPEPGQSREDEAQGGGDSFLSDTNAAVVGDDFERPTTPGADTATGGAPVVEPEPASSETATPVSSDGPVEPSSPQASSELPIGSSAAPPSRKPPVPRPDFNGDASGTPWGVDWEKWTAGQTMEFRRWFESLPLGTIPAITHEGAVAYFNLLREEQKNKADAGPSDDDDNFELTEAELAGQRGRPVRQEAETPDPAEVAAAAKKLEENGFADSAKGSRRKAKA